MSEADWRRAVEKAHALLRQGSAAEARYVLGDALAGIFPLLIEAVSADQLELAVADDTPEIPEVFHDDRGMCIREAGWVIPNEVAGACIRVASQAHESGQDDYACEDAVREVLRKAVKAGKVKRKCDV